MNVRIDHRQRNLHDVLLQSLHTVKTELAQGVLKPGRGTFFDTMVFAPYAGSIRDTNFSQDGVRAHFFPKLQASEYPSSGTWNPFFADVPLIATWRVDDHAHLQVGLVLYPLQPVLIYRSWLAGNVVPDHIARLIFVVPDCEDYDWAREYIATKIEPDLRRRFDHPACKVTLMRCDAVPDLTLG